MERRQDHIRAVKVTKQSEKDRMETLQKEIIIRHYNRYGTTTD